MTNPRDLVLPQDPDRIVPPTGTAAQLTVFVSSAMAFLAVFALAVLFTTDRLGDAWARELAQTATVRISAPVDQVEQQVERAEEILQQTPGIARVKALSADGARALLEPWFGPSLPLEDLPVPRLIEIERDNKNFDAEGLRLRLAGEVPGAVLDDHTRWRRPLVTAAKRVKLIGWAVVILIGLTLGAMVTLAARAALSANAKVIAVLRLLGARDTFVARAFTRRFTIRAASGAFAGCLWGILALLLMPDARGSQTFLSGFGLRGWEWLSLALVPALAGLVAFVATRHAALRQLKETR